MTATKTSTNQPNSKTKRLIAITTGAVLLVLGTVSALIYAGTVNFTSVEPENATLDCATIVNDSGASGGEAVQFKSSGACGSSPSGQTVPTDDIGVWEHIFYDEFTKPAALGSWGEPWDGARIVYTGAEGQQWRAYPQSYNDTYGRPYRSDQVLSVNDGVLNFYLHQVDGQPAGANPSPLIDGTSQYQTYGRYSARFKVDSPNLDEYYVAWLLWPQSEVWPDGGEIDFPEGRLSGTVNGFVHYAGDGSYGPCRPNCQKEFNTSYSFTDWHTYTIEWMPNQVRFILDDVVIGETNSSYIPDGPMRWQLQTETKGDGNNSGNLMVDWVSVWRYSP